MVLLGFAAYTGRLKTMGCLKSLIGALLHTTTGNRLEDLHSTSVFKHSSKWEPVKMISALFQNSGTMKKL